MCRGPETSVFIPGSGNNRFRPTTHADASRLKYLFKFFATLIILTAGLTFLPMWNVDHWLVRLWDFPRVQILIAIIIALIGAVVCHPWSAANRLTTATLATLGGVVSVVQGALIVPFTPLIAAEVASVKDIASVVPPRDCVSVLLANVYMKNRDPEPLIQTIGQQNPDIVFVVENDSWWSEQLAPVAERYTTVVDHPLDNTYGLLFMTRLNADHVSVEHLIEEDIPSVTALLRLPDSQRRFHFHGLHPEPPMIGQDSTPRDQELIYVAERVRALGLPAIISGDLNDVAWSHTTRLFRRVSKTLDPRIGRGTYASFHAQIPLVRWPLDHVFHTEEFELYNLEVLQDIHSDHFPLFASLCFAGAVRERNKEVDQMDEKDAKEVEETLDNV